MTKKRLSEGGDAIVLGDAARAERGVLTRPKQLPVIYIFVGVVILFSGYEFIFGFLLLP